MLKKTFTYTDYDGNEKELTAYFHLTKNDCVDLDFAFKEQGGLIAYLKTLLKESSENPNLAMDEPFVRFVRLLVSKAYGERPVGDPSLFLKEDDLGRPLVRRFKGTPAYDEFVFKLLSPKSDEDLGAFCDAIMPTINDEQRAEAEKYLKKEGIELPTPEKVQGTEPLHEV